METMEHRITLTSMLVFVAGLVFGGIYSIAIANKEFLSFETMASALILSLYYLFCIWLNTRRHQLLAVTACFFIGILLLIISVYLCQDAKEIIEVNWEKIIVVNTCIILYFIAKIQADKLILEETSNNTKNNSDNFFSTDTM